MSKWAMRALVPIVGSNEHQLEQLITHQLFGKVRRFCSTIIANSMALIDENFVVVDGWFCLIASLVATQSYRQICTIDTNDVQHSSANYQGDSPAFSQREKSGASNEIFR